MTKLNPITVLYQTNTYPIRHPQAFIKERVHSLIIVSFHYFYNVISLLVITNTNFNHRIFNPLFRNRRMLN